MSYLNDINPIFMNYGGYSRVPFGANLDNALNSVLTSQVSLPQNSIYFPSTPASGGFDISLNTPMPQFNPYTPQSTSFGDLLKSIYSSSPTGNIPDFLRQISPDTGVNNTSNPSEIPSFVSPNNKQKLAELNSQMRERVIELMKRYYNKTGKTFEISEAYRSKEDEDRRRANSAHPEMYAQKISQHTLRNGIDISRRTTSRQELATIQHIWKHEMGLTIGMDYHYKGKHLNEDWMCDGRPDISRQSKATPWTGKSGSTIASNSSSNLFGLLNGSFGSYGGGYGGFGGGYGGFGSYDNGFGNLLRSMLNSNTRFNMGGWGSNNQNSGTNFERALSYVLHREGGYSNNPNDSGGKTNYGITHNTYDKWRKNQGLPVQDVRLMTQEEARKIYYGSYWIPSGAANIADPKKARALFDTAVNLGVGTAKELYQQSGGDLNRFVQLRKQKYIAIVNNKPKNRVFLSRWLQRSDESAFS